MSRLIESIKLTGGQFPNWEYHQLRMEQSTKELYGGEGHFKLEEFLRQQKFPNEGLFKCRLLYDEKSREIEFVPYKAKSIRELRDLFSFSKIV